jgi:hypothetical protein
MVKYTKVPQIIAYIKELTFLEVPSIVCNIGTHPSHYIKGVIKRKCPKRFKSHDKIRKE